jgi:hypothetical protein
MNLGNALAALGERESETARLAEATYDGALAIFVAARADYYESICRKSRDRVRAILAVRSRSIHGYADRHANRHSGVQTDQPLLKPMV